MLYKLKSKDMSKKRELELKYKKILQEQLQKGSITKRFYNTEISVLRASKEQKQPLQYYYTYKEKTPLK